MFAVTGKRTTIVRELEDLTGEEAVRIEADLSDPGCALDPGIYTRYVLAAGVLYSRPPLELEAAEIVAALAVNLTNTIRLCEKILERDNWARICVVGSESGILGSHDRMYAAAKAGVHSYVATRPVRPSQQLVCVAPPIISDSGMTARRRDFPAVLETRAHVRARDVAEIIRGLLWSPAPLVGTGGIYRIPPLRRQ